MFGRRWGPLRYLKGLTTKGDAGDRLYGSRFFAWQRARKRVDVDQRVHRCTGITIKDVEVTRLRC